MSGTTYTPTGRFAIMTPGDPAVRDQWGTIWDNTFTIVDQGIWGNSPVDLTGLTTYTLTVANNATDEARAQLYKFTGALVATCTVTIPSVRKVGWVQNGTSGNHSVVLTTGAGRALTVTNGLTYWYSCDGTNVDTVNLGISGGITLGDFIVGAALTVTTNILAPGLQASTSYADDAAAALGGVAVGQCYRNGSVVQIRVT